MWQRLGQQAGTPGGYDDESPSETADAAAVTALALAGTGAAAVLVCRQRDRVLLAAMSGTCVMSERMSAASGRSAPEKSRFTVPSALSAALGTRMTAASAPTMDAQTSARDRTPRNKKWNPVSGAQWRPLIVSGAWWREWRAVRQVIQGIATC